MIHVILPMHLGQQKLYNYGLFEAYLGPAEDVHRYRLWFMTSRAINIDMMLTSEEIGQLLGGN